MEKNGGNLLKKLVVVLIAVLLFSIAVFAPLTQGVETIGVNVGDWFKYKGTLVSWTADPIVPFPPSSYDTMVYDYNASNYNIYTVTNVVQNSSGNFVSFNVLTNWKNGTVTNQAMDDDIDNSFTMMVIAFNLAVGTQVRPSYDWSALFGGAFSWIWPPRSITSATNVTFANGPRVCNIVDFTQPPFFEGGATPTRQIYTWDKITGIQVKFETIITSQTWYSSDFSSSGTYSYNTVLNLIDSSVAGLTTTVIPEFPPGTVLLSVFALFALLTLVFKRKHP